MKCAKPRGIVCQTDILGDERVIPNFEPFLDIPSTIKFTCYGEDSKNLSPEILQDFLNQIEANNILISIDRTFSLQDLVEVHHYIESNQAKGKLVVVV